MTAPVPYPPATPALPTETVPWLATTAEGPTLELLPTTAEERDCWTDCWVQVVLTVSVQSLMTLRSVTVLQTFLGLLTGTLLHVLTGTLRQIGAEVETGLTPLETTLESEPTILELCLVWELVCSHFVVVVVW